MRVFIATALLVATIGAQSILSETGYEHYLSDPGEADLEDALEEQRRKQDDRVTDAEVNRFVQSVDEAQRDLGELQSAQRKAEESMPARIGELELTEVESDNETAPALK